MCFKHRDPTPAIGTIAKYSRSAAPRAKSNAKATGTNACVVEDIVACQCGTTTDDGREMLSCAGCGVWHHTAWVLQNSTSLDLLPSHYLCKKCDHERAGALSRDDDTDAGTHEPRRIYGRGRGRPKGSKNKKTLVSNFYMSKCLHLNHAQQRTCEACGELRPHLHIINKFML